MPPPALRLGPLDLGAVPRVVGVVRDPATLARLADAPVPFDLLEVRLDLLGTDTPWREPVRALRQQGVPTILTLRHASEGGAWSGDEPARQAILRAALPDVAAVDVELATRWLPDLLPACRDAEVRILASFHDFVRTPDADALDAVVGRGRVLGADIVKLAALAPDEEALSRLAALPARHPDVRLCLLGMGAMGPASRVSLPLAGSCLTYGFADAPSAPGQLAAAELRRRLAEAHAGYRAALEAGR